MTFKQGDTISNVALYNAIEKDGSKLDFNKVDTLTHAAYLVACWCTYFL